MSRKSHWRGIVISRVGRLFFYESSDFHDTSSAGKVRRAARVPTSEPRLEAGEAMWARDAVSQETCHPAWAFRPRRSLVSNAITEVVLAFRSLPRRAAGALIGFRHLSLMRAI